MLLLFCLSTTGLPVNKSCLPFNHCLHLTRLHLPVTLFPLYFLPLHVRYCSVVVKQLLLVTAQAWGGVCEILLTLFPWLCTVMHGSVAAHTYPAATAESNPTSVPQQNQIACVSSEAMTMCFTQEHHIMTLLSVMAASTG